MQTQTYIEKWRDHKGVMHYLDAAGNEYEPLEGELSGLGSIFSNLFQKKEGGSRVGNLIRSAGSFVTGKPATVVRPQTTSPTSTNRNSPAPNYPQPQQPAGNNNMLLIAGAGVAVVAAVLLMNKKKGK